MEAVDGGRKHFNLCGLYSNNIHFIINYNATGLSNILFEYYYCDHHTRCPHPSLGEKWICFVALRCV